MKILCDGSTAVEELRLLWKKHSGELVVRKYHGQVFLCSVTGSETVVFDTVAFDSYKEAKRVRRLL